ncbi:NAD(P)H-binding protein [Roseateles violae]|uniref:NAD(P)H-binding protein n=1 Tax=Roseateles violae TaxID=3058042 RepID=A0ABT8DX68_9BURK|nr:NAD(P)H-binding protein [Pelomonas sp. PFR6]MDN3921870.1 NAD(P)H-binding protein [Pelomonas sp. PFR6]
MKDKNKSIWVAGASGLVGRALLSELLQQPGDDTEIHALLRRPVEGLPPSPRLHAQRLDFARPDLAALPAPTTIYICLGTTIKQAGSQEAFRAVDYEAVLTLARAARAAGATRCAVVSALGAKATSTVFYNRVKGEMEEALIALGFERLVIARPSLLIGERAALGQPVRKGEVWGERIGRLLRPLLPARWRPIEAARVARAMRRALSEDGPAVQRLESETLQRLGR